MPDAAVNGTSHYNRCVTPESEAKSPDATAPTTPSSRLIPDFLSIQSQENETLDHTDGPPQKRRKLIGSTSRRSTPRAPSPPWKKVEVDGPTSFFQDGRRKSSRTNVLPLELQPESAKRPTQTAQRQYDNRLTVTARPYTPSPLSKSSSRWEVIGQSPGPTSPNAPLRGPHRRRLHPSQSPAPQPAYTRSRSQSLVAANPSVQNLMSSRISRSKPATPSQHPTIENVDQNQATAPRVPRLKFRVRKPSLNVLHPGHVLAPRKFCSFREWLQNDEILLNEDDILSAPEALEEARRRHKVLRAAEPGGLLSSTVCSAYLSDAQDEPPQQYTHQDHLVVHALHFRKLLDQEHRRHRNTARLLAQWCADAWRKRHKLPEDIVKQQQEEIQSKRKHLIRDLQKMFDLARAEMDRIRLARWEEERKVEDQQALDRAIKRSTMLFEKRRMEILGEVGSDMIEESDDDDDDDETTGSASGDDDNESNMSSTDSETQSDEGTDDDEGLTAEELRIKYANLPDSTNGPDWSSIAPSEADSEASDDIAESAQLEGEQGSSRLATAEDSLAQVELDEVDPMLLDDCDGSTDMDDDDNTDDGTSGSVEGSDADEGVEGPGLLGFFSSKAIASFQGQESDEDQDEAGNVPDHKSLTVHEEEAEGPVQKSPIRSDPAETEPIPSGTLQLKSTVDNSHDNGAESAPPAAEPMGAFDTFEPNHEESAPIMPGIESSETCNPEKSELIVPNADVHEKRPGSRPSEDVSSEESPDSYATKPSDPESVSSCETSTDQALEPSASPNSLGLKTPIPHLLRGNLREYQHFGLDWLAGLYTNHINGILADEMGLGKTIQTIALLAHLAVEHEVWGPHLIVVPTSVMLNWEMEFKKWCPGFKIMTYYGNQEERRQKRRGWTDDNSWNVLITSYQLVLQDQQVLKRRAWHYMVLDEAHNIKNFRSQRWQALLTFRTRARLLLTGTPLQNNLTELWSLLFFLMPSDGDGSGVEGFADLRNFSEWFRRPVEQILEHGRETMDEETKRVVTKLHTVLRPYILRRLKADVEKQMPAKYEHVVYCRLSKRQRYLYDGFLSRAQTKETLASGNYLSIINCLMQLRKVCNHPDLFETRPISTSFAMPKSVVTDYEINDLLVRRRLLDEHPLSKVDLDFLNLAPISREDISCRVTGDCAKIMAYAPFEKLREQQYKRTNWLMGFNGSSVQSVLDSLENAARKRRMEELERSLYFESKRHGRRPLYGSSLIELLTIDTTQDVLSKSPLRKRAMAEKLMSQSSVLASMVLSIEEQSQALEGYIQRFACVTPAAVAAGITNAALTPIQTRHLSESQQYLPHDPFHESQMRLSIAFPDKRLLQYDCGKLQRLDKLLRDLKAGGHRALIFTQMTKMLDILEQFLNIHGHLYLRLDGTTKVEQRQILTDRFNNDSRILAFILSTRSGGLGINLTGADTVIFYDLDWNPAMDKQCQDRCHRIGQTRDVHIYRFVSEYTIESNILRKANQKRMLDDVVIQEGEFTTDYFTKQDVRDMIGHDELVSQDEASAAMDRVLDTRGAGVSRAFESAEDKEDIDAAQNAQKELELADDGDFEDHYSVFGQPGPSKIGTPLPSGLDEGSTPGPQLIGTPRVTNEGEEIEVEPRPGHIDDYLLRLMEWYLKDEPLVLPSDKSKKFKKGKEHRLRRRRR